MDLICNYWPRWFREQFDDEFPSCYCAWDTETTGFATEYDLIWEIGHVLVQDNKVTNQMRLVLDWTREPSVDPCWLQQRLNQMRQGLNLRGLACRDVWELMRTEGKNPRSTLKFYKSFFEKLNGNGVPAVTHNGYAFDERMLSNHFKRFCGETGFKLRDTMWDTLAVEKGNLLVASGDHQKALPNKFETMRQWCLRVKHLKTPGIKADIEAIVDRYEFDTRYGVELGDLHNALEDSKCLHYLMQDFGKAYAPVVLQTEPLSAARPPLPPKQLPMAAGQLRRRGQRVR